jgi:hypothetical protein
MAITNKAYEVKIIGSKKDLKQLKPQQMVNLQVDILSANY